MVLAARTLRMNCFTTCLVSLVPVAGLFRKVRTRAHCNGRWDPRLSLRVDILQTRAIPMSELRGCRMSMPSIRVVVASLDTPLVVR